MRLSDYLEPDLVLRDLQTSGVEDTLRALVDRLAAVDASLDADAILASLLEREESHTTSLGNGVALPHAIIPGLDEPRLLVATAPDGIPYGPADAQGVRSLERVFFLLLSPANEAGTHIKLLARIVRLVRRADFMKTLLNATSEEALIEAIERVDALHV